MRVLLAAAMAAFLMAAPATAGPDRMIETFAKLEASVGALYAQEPDGDLRFLCSATAVDREGADTVLLTAHHCMRRGVSYLVNFGDKAFREARVWKIPHYEVDADEYPRRFNEPLTDMALMLMPGHDIPVVPLAVSSRLEPGALVAMVGFPLGVAKIAYQGGVAGRFDRLGADMFDYLLLQIFGAPGSSGSAVVDVDSGEIVAVLVAAKQGPVGLPVIFATPIEYREHLMPVLPDDERLADEE